jgi:hypothetical protein
MIPIKLKNLKKPEPLNKQNETLPSVQKLRVLKPSNIFSFASAITRHSKNNEETPERKANESHKTDAEERIPLQSRANSLESKKLHDSGKKQTNQTFIKKQEKAFSQLAAIVIGFTICFTPYFVVFLVVALCSTCVNTYVSDFALWLGYANSAINPFLYTLSSQRFRKKFKDSKQFPNQNHNHNTHHNNHNFTRVKQTSKEVS